MFICLACIIIGSILVGTLLKRNGSKPTESKNSGASSESSGSETTLTSTPPTETTAPVSTITAEERAVLLDKLETDITSFLSSQSGRYSMVYINLKNGETVSYNGEIPMVAASSVKIAYNTYLYQRAAAGDFAMSDTMTYNAAAYPGGDFEAGTGTIQNSPDGTSYALSEITGLSIRISDNCATNMLLRKLGGIDVVNDSYMTPISAVVGYRTPVSYTDYKGTQQSGRHRTSSLDLAKYAQELYLLYTADPASYEALINDLSNTEYTWGIPAGVSGNTKVAHKVGFNSAYGSNNDVGIVFGTEDYVICVMTETGESVTAQENIGAVSRLVSDYILSCYE
jgi:beta-lactamase class A